MPRTRQWRAHSIARWRPTSWSSRASLTTASVATKRNSLTNWSVLSRSRRCSGRAKTACLARSGTGGRHQTSVPARSGRSRLCPKNTRSSRRPSSNTTRVTWRSGACDTLVDQTRPIGRSQSTAPCQPARALSWTTTAMSASLHSSTCAVDEPTEPTNQIDRTEGSVLSKAATSAASCCCQRGLSTITGSVRQKSARSHLRSSFDSTRGATSSPFCRGSMWSLSGRSTSTVLIVVTSDLVDAYDCWSRATADAREHGPG